MLKTIYKDFPKSSASRHFTPWSGYCFLLEKTARYQLGVLLVVKLPLQIKFFQSTERDFEGIEFYKRDFNLEMFNFFSYIKDFLKILHVIIFFNQFFIVFIFIIR